MTDQSSFEGIDAARIAATIDHTCLKADAGIPQLEQLCGEAVELGFFSVCVNSSRVPICRRLLSGTQVGISAVCGFPLGASMSEVKAYEAARAMEMGATEIDMVLPIGALIDGQHELVRQDIAAVVQAVAGGAKVKVILETGLLTHEQKRVGCQLAEEAGAHFVKTSTGFGPGGATVEDIGLMKESVSASMGIKASGGIRDLAVARSMLAAGATRLGTSSGVAIIRGLRDDGGY